MFKFRPLALLIVLALILANPVFGGAYGSEDHKLTITHIDTNCTEEGAAIILTPDMGETVGAISSFEWWFLTVFDWDSNQSCYKLIEKHIAVQTNKSNVVIPKNGFVYASNHGNNYPQLYKDTGNSAFADKPNYKNKPVLDSLDYLESGDIPVGAKAYLYNTDIKNKSISNNGANWYEEGYVSDSFIKIGEPEATGTPYNPEEAQEILFKINLGITHNNTDGIANNMSILFDDTYGKDIQSKGSQRYGWWKTATFEWDEKEDVYVVTSLSLKLGQENRKQPLIPDKGFVLAVCTGGPIADMTSNNLDKVKIGQKAYLYKSEQSGSFDAITINLPEESRQEYRPDFGATRLEVPELIDMDSDSTIVGEKEIKVSWNPVAGAEKYYVAFSDITFNSDSLILSRAHSSATGFTIDKKMVSIGKTYNLSIYATAPGKESSRILSCKISIISQEAATSNIRTKKIVAFGDSITARTGWVDMLGGRFGAGIINSGVGGQSADAGRARFDQDVLAHNPDIVIINFGMNDQAHVIAQNRSNKSLKDYTNHLEYFAKTLTDNNIEVLFVTPNKVLTQTGYYTPGAYGLDYGTDNMLDFCNAMREVAQKYGCGLVDINYNNSLGNLAEFVAAGDGIHPSEKGHEGYAQMIGDYLVALYDNKDASFVEIEYKDTEGEAITSSVTLKGAKGSKMLIPPLPIEGYVSQDETVAYTFVEGGGKVTFVYSLTSNSITLKPDSEYKIQDGYLHINKEKTTESDLLSNIINTNVNLQAFVGTVIGTGSILTLPGEQGYELEVVLKGDANGDGSVDAKDFLFIKRHFLQTYDLTGGFFLAGDVDDNGKINASDYLRIKRHFLQTFNIYE